MPELIKSASDITVWSLVDCSNIPSIIPDRFTMPVILTSPASGRLFFTPSPGFKGVSDKVTYPMWLCVPREASTAITKGLS